MNTNLQYSIGTRFVREKGGIATKHHAVYVGNGVVAENQVGVGVRCITLKQFLSEGELVRVEHFEGNYWQKQTILQRVQALIGKSYNLLTYNCEHFVNQVLYGMPKSRQIEIASLGTIGVGLVTMLKFPIAGAVIGVAGAFAWLYNEFFSED